MCPHDPSTIRGPIGMYHCPQCGEMVVAGMAHPDYDQLELLAGEPEQLPFQFLKPTEEERRDGRS